MNFLKDSKIWVRLVLGISIMMIVSWSVIIWWVTAQQQEMGIKQAKDFSVSVNQMTIASLTALMIIEKMDKRDIYLDQIQKSENVTELHTVKGAEIDKEFNRTASDRMPDAVEQQVLTSGKPYFQVIKNAQGEILRAVIPSTNEKNYLGKDCTKCHGAPDGAVLGVVSMNISLNKINDAIRDASLKFVVAAVGVAVLLIGFIYVFVNRSVSVPLVKLAHSLREIAEGEGDLTRRLKVERNDEIGRTSVIFNTFMDKLQSVVKDVKLSAERVMATSQQLSSAANELTRSSNEQSDATASMAASLEEVTVSIKQVADNSDRAHEMASEAGGLSGEGHKAVGEAIEEMQKISDSVNSSSAAITTLEEKSTQITSVANVIKDIADQTNLLALNAAIEAARAGEQGRGFAVVADEVRKLAERTATATHEITNTIDEIQQSTQRSVSGMEFSVGQVQKGVEMARHSGVAMANIETSTNKVKASVDEISLALREQSTAATQLAQDVEVIAQKAERNGALANESAQAANHLAELAVTLKQSVDRFVV
ncbi:MAG: methyl-accepting chemotaxis protein [Proteobacteria bacterium]|nr:methyl-accepting chemotaxis protein [Pseudomonadota bacterium]